MAVTEKNMDQSTFEWSQQALGITPNEIFGHAETGHIVGNSHRKWMAKPGSIGRPYPGHRVAVVDAQGTPCAVGSVGEIALRSEERRVGKECVSPCRSRGARAH